MAAPTQLDNDGGPMELEAAVRQYSDWGWLVATVDGRALLTTDWSISAVEMPAVLGREVAQYLNVRMLGGPVVDLPGQPQRCLMLTASADDAASVDIARLHSRGVCVHRRGTLVPLPPSLLKCGPVRWRTPASLERPVLAPFSGAADAVRAITETSGVSSARRAHP